MPVRFALVIATATMLATAAEAQSIPPRWDAIWPQTDFSRSSVSFEEIRDGGPGKDGIPAIDDPVFVPIAGDDVLAPDEPVVTVALDGVPARAYPIRYLTWHEIVNDEIAGVPVAVTFCPLCNTHLVFDRRVDGAVLSFGVSGLLRHSDMIMYDRETESWWQQFTGEAIVGDLLGAELTTIPAWMESRASFEASHPDGLVMAQPDRFRRPYGENPYVNYDSLRRPFLYDGEMPPHGIEPLSRVVRVGERAWPLSRIAEAGVLEEAGLRIAWEAGMASALDGRFIAGSRDIGQIRVFDATTGDDVAHEIAFAFAFHAFHPDGEWMLQ